MTVAARVLPTARLLGLFAVPFALGVAAFVLRVVGGDVRLGIAAWAADFVWGVLGSVALLALIDLVLSWRRPPLRVRREVPQNLSQGEWQEVYLHFTNESERALAVEVFDGVPSAFALRQLPQDVVLPPAANVRLGYSVRGDARGDFHYGPLALRRGSLFGFWRFRELLDLPQHVRVYPDFSWLSGTLELVGEQRMQRAGIKLAPRRGEGMEFHQLREYRAGDSQRQVDWKASARRTVLISREYQEERDQQILMVLDTGSRMRAMDGPLAHFDHALRAMLLLAFVALRQGDAVGLLSFGGTPRWLGMQRGAGAVNRLLGAVYDLQTGPNASDYLALAQEIRRRQRRRALVVVLTNAREEDEDLLPALELLRSRHIVLVTSLRESVLADIDRTPVRTLEDALRFASVSASVLERDRVRDAVHRTGNILLDCTPAELPVRLVHDYWGLKRSGRL